MKIQAQSSLLLRQALQKAAKCIDSKTAIAILSNVLLTQRKEDVKDIGTEHLVKYAHSLALDLLKDKDGVYGIREYFLK